MGAGWPRNVRPLPSRTCWHARGSYLAEYEARFSAVVSAEHYLQRSYRLRTSTTVQLESDVIWLNVGQDTWIAFRDVFEVNGLPVRDHDQRLEKLFLQSPNQAMVEARGIIQESARYNVGTLRPGHQRADAGADVPARREPGAVRVQAGRHRGRRGGASRRPDVQGAVQAGGDSFRHSRRAGDRTFLDRRAVGRVLKSELNVSADSTNAKIVVTYRPAPNLDIWAPAIMSERYALTTGENITGEATYSNFRQFAVSVGSTIK